MFKISSSKHRNREIRSVQKKSGGILRRYKLLKYKTFTWRGFLPSERRRKHVGAYRSSFHLFFDFCLFSFLLRCIALKCPNENSALRNNHDYTFHNNTRRTRRTRGNTNDAVYKKLNIVSEKRFYTKVMKAFFLRPAFKNRVNTSWRVFVFTKGLIPLTCSLFLQYLKGIKTSNVFTYIFETIIQA